MTRRIAAILVLPAFAFANFATEAGAQSGQRPTDRTVAEVNARELPVEQYARLSTDALSKAVARLGPRIKNPRLSRGGLDQEIAAILDEQHRYLHNSGNRNLSELRLASAPDAGRFHTPTSSGCLSPAIEMVNGRRSGAILTPRPGDNHIRVEGCGFGSEPGEVHLQLDSGKTRSINLQLTGAHAWSDREINLRLDPGLTGITDSRATLAVRLADGQKIEIQDCRFVAARGEPLALKTVAASSVQLGTSSSPSVSLPQLEYVSPPIVGQEIPPDAARVSALVIRSASQPFEAGTDRYDLATLNPGWVIDSIQIQTYAISCPGDVTRTVKFGEWNTQFDERGVTVSWAGHSCSSFIPPVFQFNLSASEYGLKVWLTGPIGTDPFPAGHNKVAKQVKQ